MNFQKVLWIFASLTLTFALKKEADISLLDQMRLDFFTLEDQLWHMVKEITNSHLHDKEPYQVKLLKKFQAYGDKLQENFPDDISIPILDSVWSWAKTYTELRSVYALYEAFRRFQKQQTDPDRVPAPKRAWLDLTDGILHDSKNSVNETFERVLEMVTERHVFTDALKEVNDMICSNNQSPQQVLYSLYNTIALTELKGYTMIQFSYMLLKLYGEGNFTKESNIVRSRFEARTNKALEVVKYAMHDASRDYWRCDPRKHVKGETYEEITQLLQGYVQNEVDMNPDGTCRENCGEYQYAKSYGCFQNQFCSQQRRCNGKILNCKYVDSDMKICTSDIKSGRRYESIEYENGLVYGRKQACARGTTKVDSWWRWLFWHCSYCICLCDEQGPHSDRYINMRPSIANLEMNRVVTGLRFVKKNRIVHLQIQEGELLPYGNINSTSLQWVEPEDYHIEDYKVYAGQDYHVLSWEKRAVDLDDLQVDHTHVVTGVRFKEVGSHLNFEIYVSPFNFTSGKLDNPLSKSEWRDNLNTELSRKPRTKLNIYNPDIPTRSLTPSEPLSKSDQYLEFVNTDFERDAAQTTIPFLDAQPVASSKPVPLSGAGIFYKGVRHFGGFIAPKVITYDVSEHLKPVFPGPPEDQENAVSLEEINTVSVI